MTFGSHYPPGVTESMIGGGDLYECSKCGNPITDDEIDGDASEGGDNVCNECAVKLKEEDEEENE